jgi:hypothetical protein
MFAGSATVGHLLIHYHQDAWLQYHTLSCSTAAGTLSGTIRIHVHVIVISLHVLLLDEIRNSLLNKRNLWDEVCLDLYDDRSLEFLIV